ncbi:nucleolar MIF4G domain-containing protein 1 [Belonocnema kinseyi]|uniref:nucleolar MIF4G domain-containing protein 1 n=1 Tax=Belonocnema kinseyi TaxID=2817044 RepID=UPI00143D55C6|nr:nucleolar MIF4G domain-containing protein 1 [Belonocnema kinseyi]
MQNVHDQTRVKLWLCSSYISCLTFVKFSSEKYPSCKMSAVKYSSKGKNKGKKKRPVQKTRKELRKEKRVQKKQNRKLFHEKKKSEPQESGKFVLNPKGLDQHVKKENKSEKEKNVQDRLQKELENEKKKEQRLEKEMARKRRRQLKEANMEEDRNIKHLEKQLKLNRRKSKNVPKSFASDGLDYLLDFCDEENRKIAVEAEKQLLGADSGSEFEDDFAVATGETAKKDNKKNKKLSKINKSDSEASCNSDDNFDDSSKKGKFNSKLSKKSQPDESEEEDDFSLDEDMEDEEDEEYEDEVEDEEESLESKKRKLESNQKTVSEQKKRKISESEDLEEEMEADSDSEEDLGNPEEDEENTKLWEDIYGRTRDKDGNVVTNRYVPPAAREKNLKEDSENSEKLIRLRRQLKGPLNRLTDRNMHTIAGQIDELFLTNSRNDMNEMLSKLMMEAIVAPIMTPDRLIMEHMMLIAVLHANVGSEVGAQFLLNLVKKIEEKLNSPQEVENKELDNLILMFSHLYNFKIFGSKLIYEILEKLSEKFSEKEIELILLILKSVGFVLRKDDPLSLKELVIKLQQKAALAKSENLRVKFMIDVLMAIKNNNMNKIPQYDPSVLEHLKKVLKTLIRTGNGISQLNITLEDLLQVDERGKWWIVGAAWSGSTSLGKQEKSVEDKPKFSAKLLELARKQRMNTDARRNVFCILMSAEDYLDAFEKLHHLGLKDGQEKEIIYVLMNCCLQEKNFNPYYALLAQKFCDYDRKYQMTIQYTLWDKLKTLENFNNKQLKNLARFLTHLFLHRGLSISTMKVVQLEELDKPKMKLLRQIVLGILMHENSEACLGVFERITRSEQLDNFREALRLFITQFVVRNAKEGLIPEDKAVLIKERAELVDRLLATRNSRIVF